MKLITVNLPDSYLKLLEKNSLCSGISRSELLRQAIRSYLIKELKFAKRLEKALEDKKITRFFNYCINCDQRLHTISSGNHHFHKNVEVFELRFCCSCYERFKDISIDEFPEHLIKKIQRKIKIFKNYMNSDMIY
ncbi:MAG: ribbon-helix-helix domain-containing protein [Candidatus Hodarchaeota archaeon]